MTRARDAAGAVLCGAFAFVLALAPVSDVDFFWHLAVGRHVATHGALPGKNLWSFTAPDHPFEATAWLFDVCIYGLHQAFGVAGVQVAVALVLGGAFALVFLTARRRLAPFPLALMLTLLAALASQSRLTQRPQAVTYLFLALAGWLVAVGGKWRWALIPLIAVWSNFHAGCVFGAGLVGLVALSHTVERFRGKPNQAPSWALCAALCVVALVCNPSGAGEVRYALFHLGTVTSVVDLAEFQSPGLSTHGVFWVLVGLGAFAALIRFEVEQALVVAAFAVLAARAMYVAPMFSLVSVPFTALALGARMTGRVQAIAAPAIAVVSLFLVPEPLTHFVRRVQLGVDPYRVPEAGAAAARALGMQGPVFTSWDLAGLVEWSCPESRVYADPRLLAYPPEVFSALAKAEESQADFDALLAKYDVRWAFRSQRVLKLSGVGRFPPATWALLYWDEASLVFVRRDQLGDRREVRFFLPAAPVLDTYRALKGDDREAWWAEVQDAAKRSPRLATAQIASCLELGRRGQPAEAAKACDAAVAVMEERERFFPLEGQTRRIEAGIAFGLLGEFQRAEDVAPKSPEVLTALGGMLLAKDKAKARAYFERALALRPDFAPAQKGKEAAQR